jgi:hypothetical protein
MPMNKPKPKAKTVVRSARAVEGSKTYTKRGANKVAEKNAPLRKNTTLQRNFTKGKKEYQSGTGLFSPVRGMVKEDVYQVKRRIENLEINKQDGYRFLMAQSKNMANSAKALKKVAEGKDYAVIAGQYRQAAAKFAKEYKR